MLLKLTTARNVGVFMTDAADHLTGKTGLTLTITASKDGAAFASITPTVTELSYGVYNLAFTTGHTDTLNDLLLHVTGTGADPTDMKFQVVTDLPGGTVTLPASERNSIADAHLDRVDGIEVGLTPRQAHRLEATAAAGKVSGAATTTVILRNAVADSKNRIVATVDGSGNRSAITTDVT